MSVKVMVDTAEKLINFTKKSYNKIPAGVLNIFAPIFWDIPGRRRYGNTFVDTWDMLEREEFQSKDEFDELVRKKLYTYNSDLL